MHEMPEDKITRWQKVNQLTSTGLQPRHHIVDSVLDRVRPERARRRAQVKLHVVCATRRVRVGGHLGPVIDARVIVCEPLIV